MKSSTIGFIGGVITQILAVPLLYQMFQQLYLQKLPNTMELQFYWVMFFIVALFIPPLLLFTAAYLRKMGN